MNPQTPSSRGWRPDERPDAGRPHAQGPPAGDLAAFGAALLDDKHEPLRLAAIDAAGLWRLRPCRRDCWAWPRLRRHARPVAQPLSTAWPFLGPARARRLSFMLCQQASRPRCAAWPWRRWRTGCQRGGRATDGIDEGRTDCRSGQQRAGDCRPRRRARGGRQRDRGSTTSAGRREAGRSRRACIGGRNRPRSPRH